LCLTHHQPPQAAKTAVTTTTNARKRLRIATLLLLSCVSHALPASSYVQTHKKAASGKAAYPRTIIACLAARTRRPAPPSVRGIGRDEGARSSPCLERCRAAAK